MTTATCRKAIWLVLHKHTHVWCADEVDEETGEKTYVFYVLCQDNELGEKRCVSRCVSHSVSRCVSHGVSHCVA